MGAGELGGDEGGLHEGGEIGDVEVAVELDQPVADLLERCAARDELADGFDETVEGIAGIVLEALGERVAGVGLGLGERGRLGRS